MFILVFIILFSIPSMNFDTQPNSSHLRPSLNSLRENTRMIKLNISEFSNKIPVLRENQTNNLKKHQLNNSLYRNLSRNSNMISNATSFKSMHTTYQKNIIESPKSKVQQQVIYINNRKFIKSKSPSTLSPSLKIIKENQTNKYEEPKSFMSESMKIKILQNRVMQLHQQKQSEIIEILNQNKRIQKQLQIQKQKSRKLMDNSNLFTPIKNIQICDEQYFEQHEKRIQDMKKRIIDLQKALGSSKSQTDDLQKKNQELKQENISCGNHDQNGFQTPPSLKPLQINYIKSNESPFQNLYEDSSKKSQSSVVIQKISQQQIKLEIQNKKLTDQLSELREEIRKLRAENQMKTDLILQKQQTIEKVSRLKLQQQQQVKLLKAQIKFLLQKIKGIEEGLLLHKENANAKQSQNRKTKQTIPVTFADSQIIDIQAIGSEKLQNVSFGHSFIINQKNEPVLNKISTEQFGHDSQIMSIGSLAEETPQSAKLLKQLRENGCQKQLSQFKLNDQDDFAINQASLQVSMSNIFGKIQHLTSNNDKIQQENKMLKQKNLQLKKENRTLEHKLNMIYQIIHKKQCQLDSKQTNQPILKNTLEDLEFMLKSIGINNPNYSNELIARISASGQRIQDSTACVSCIQLRKLISKMRTAENSYSDIDAKFI